MFEKNLHIETLICDNVSQLFGILRIENTEIWGDDIEPEWVFRGQADVKWPLLPKVWRPEVQETLLKTLPRVLDFTHGNFSNFVSYYEERAVEEAKLDPSNRSNPNGISVSELMRAECSHVVAIRLLEEIVLREFYRICDDIALLSEMVETNDLNRAVAAGDFEKLCEFQYTDDTVGLAQHSGIPTRFLDWTKDPQKALVFALNNNDMSQNELCIWALNTKMISAVTVPSYREVTFKTVDASRAKNKYLDAQDGVFTVAYNAEKFFLGEKRYPSLDDDSIYLQNGGTLLRKIIVPLDRNSKRDIVKMLLRSRKTIAHLMPSFEKGAEATIGNLQARIDRYFD